MTFLQWPYCLLNIALLLGFEAVLAAGLAVPQRTLYVDQSGHGDFSSIQEAIHSIPSNNIDWVQIRVAAGTYKEKVNIPYDKPYILIKGAGKRRTKVVWGDHDSVAQSPTFSSLADNIVVKSMGFVNSYNIRGSKNPRTPAVAAMISGDKSYFYKCAFTSLQDTLWDNQGRHYFRSCIIQGAVDFIFGSGQSIYEDCVVHVLGGALETGLAGYITAQGRINPTDANGFVFKNCFVSGTGLTFLGRPWRGYARVLFYNSNFSDIIVPQGWDAWNIGGHEGQLTFAEYNNYGPGSDTSQRVSWAKKLTAYEAKQLTSINFIDREGWLQSQPL